MTVTISYYPKEETLLVCITQMDTWLRCPAVSEQNVWSYDSKANLMPNVQNATLANLKYVYFRDCTVIVACYSNVIEHIDMRSSLKVRLSSKHEASVST